MTPAQATSTLESPEEAAKLRDVKQLILGGGATEEPLLSIVRGFPHGVWSTYGMTETLSHIALKRLNGNEASDWYTPFEGVSLRLTEDRTLAITAPGVCAEELITNDIAELTENGRFRILGRRDNVINSGGIKLQIEELEKKISAVLPCSFQITAAPDTHYGEVVVMLVQGAPPPDWSARCRSILPSYACPKHIFSLTELPQTESGKPARAEARALAAHLSSTQLSAK
jgi:O-succinylbenzoic acid--CoA ligase